MATPASSATSLQEKMNLGSQHLVLCGLRGGLIGTVDSWLSGHTLGFVSLTWYPGYQETPCLCSKRRGGGAWLCPLHGLIRGLGQPGAWLGYKAPGFCPICVPRSPMFPPSEGHLDLQMKVSSPAIAHAMLRTSPLPRSLR